ncbi:hypothetical protein D3C80_1190370 [compost metagenome]
MPQHRVLATQLRALGGVEFQPATGKRLDLERQGKIEAEHHFQVQGVARFLGEQAGEIAEQFAAQGRALPVEFLLLCLGTETHQVEQVAVEVRGAVAFVLDVELVLLPGLVEQRGHAVRKDVEERVGRVIPVLDVPLDQQLGVRARQYARRPDQPHEGHLHLGQRQAGHGHLAFTLELQIADFTGREVERQLRAKTQRVFVRSGFQVHAPGSAVMQAKQAHQLEKLESVRLSPCLVDQTRG